MGKVGASSMLTTALSVIFVFLLMFPFLVGRIIEDIGRYIRYRRNMREMERRTREVLGKDWRR